MSLEFVDLSLTVVIQIIGNEVDIFFLNNLIAFQKGNKSNSRNTKNSSGK
ncbi:hypothetical protein VIBNISO65_1780017 [Vibrio nigripulchritudo SO65]|nr:hypothetical protein VIBNIFTn2_50077 [Vibrio nigripulchritudo FTn2]CCN63710.1 hypothetical protein VIBNIPon4_150040 [Vibrio nigripulchritudo POn4]CCN77035.1 hypothetical protein VIBNISO65_1780017 [Vibrio nigripulchritudo SO65]